MWALVGLAFAAGGFAGAWVETVLARAVWSSPRPGALRWPWRLWSWWVGRGCNHVRWGAVEPVAGHGAFGWQCGRCGALFTKAPVRARSR
jgi:hypothetical protein